MGLLFTLYIAFAVLAMMNVVTAIFIESALASAKDDRDIDMVNQLRELFMLADTDDSGMISWDEFNTAVENPKLANYFKGLELDISEARGLFSLLDVENTGQINGEEFVYGCLRLRGMAKAIDLATLMYYNKRMSSRWRAHSSKVEAILEEMACHIFGNREKYEAVTSNRRSIDSMQSECSSWEQLKAEGRRKSMMVKIPNSGQPSTTPGIAASNNASPSLSPIPP
eukprot:gnl/TRDRNA2_/TRDRNA2_123781_c0_seq1.p1 gnl/TRDRNA2_/TRDRNA2_123781_c0~~gnl/TRDRNA2_/TRDRNA2_123781_c0_seq1.p1  ORF type:complete len:226 (+),score=36.95 gnl/TRDRNA2_/TRDRNA2_123781_c0_seq1:3-680(+)